jgi:hypothetical protein
VGAGKAEVSHHGAQPARGRDQHDVGRLEIAVDHSGIVRRRQPLPHLAHDRQRFLEAQLAVAAQPLLERLAGEQLHAEEADLRPLSFRLLQAVAEQVEDAAHIRVGDLAGQLDLAPEAVEGAFEVGDLGANRLQGYAVAQLEILGLVDVPHAAVADEADDLEAPRQHLPGCQMDRRRPWPSTAGPACARRRRG